VLITFVDVTTLKHQEQLIKKQETRLAEAERLSWLGVLAGGISHEINNPLTIIKGRTDLMRQRLQHEVPSREALLESLLKDVDGIEKNVARIRNVTQVLRQFAGDPGNDIEFGIPVRELIDNALSFCRERFHNHGILLVEASVPDSMTIDGRPIELTQALYNVLINAFDAVIQVRERWVRIEVSEHGGKVEVAVIDSGPGIAREHREKILMPFFTTKAPGQGTGMGLSVAARLVETNGGELRLERDQSHTTFVLSLVKKRNRRVA
jgi:C4-dicarboxylate-specific signal transduction histidine kinase